MQKKKAAERKKKPEGHNTVKTPSICLPGKMQPGYDGCPCLPRPPGWSEVTVGSKVIDSRITPESVSWFMLMLLRYCEDSVPLQTTVYSPVLNFSGSYGRSAHTNKDGFVCQRGFFLIIILADKVRHSWKSKLSLSCLLKKHAGSVCLIINQGCRIKTVTYGCVCLFSCLSAAISPSGLVSQHLLTQILWVCLFNKASKVEVVHL